MRKESRIFNSSRYLAILLYVYQGQTLSHPTGQWFRRQLCCLKSWITKEQCHHRKIAQPAPRDLNSQYWSDIFSVSSHSFCFIFFTTSRSFPDPYDVSYRTNWLIARPKGLIFYCNYLLHIKAFANRFLYYHSSILATNFTLFYNKSVFRDFMYM